MKAHNGQAILEDNEKSLLPNGTNRETNKRGASGTHLQGSR